MKYKFGQYLRMCLILWCACVLSACATGISKEARSKVTYTGPFNEVQQQPAKYQGETVIWGGRVINTQAKDDSTEITVLQLNLGSGQRPLDNDQSLGRFLVQSSEFLDPAIYPKGTLITVVGPVKGEEVRNIGDLEYRYPVIEVAEIKKWQPRQDTSPRIHFGIGIGTRF